MRLIMITAAFLGIVASASAEPRSARKPRVEMVEIGTAFPYATTIPVAINNHGVVVGFAWHPDEYWIFTWTPSIGFDLILFDGVPTDINDRGQVVGKVERCIYIYDDYYYGYGYEDRCYETGFVWSASDGLKDLGDFVPAAINNDGDMAGVCWSNSQPCAMLDGVLTVVPTDPVGDGYATAINDKGVVAGFYTIGNPEDGDYGNRPFTWSHRDGLRTLSRGTAASANVAAINSRGMVVGTTNDQLWDYQSRATIWTGKQILRQSPPDQTSWVAVNKHGLVVGNRWSETKPTQPMMWLPKSGITAFPRSGWTSGYAADVNDSGQVVGVASGKAIIWRVRP